MNGFLLHGPAEARWNMSVDNWLAEHAPLAPGELMVRLYQWSPGAISVGRNQLWQKAIHLPNLPAGQLAVRRITGGRAIYHDESELTYSIALELGSRTPNCALANDALTIDKPLIRKTSLKVSHALVEFLHRLSVTARIERGQILSGDTQPAETGPAETGPVETGPLEKHDLTRACFESVSRYEITAKGQKIVAGAQRIIGTRYFQHGSIKIAGVAPHPALISKARGRNRADIADIADIAHILAANGNKNTPGSCSTGREAPPSIDSMARAFKAAFEQVFDCMLPAICLTEADRSAINDLQTGLDSIIGLPGPSKSAILAPEIGRAERPHKVAHQAESLAPFSLTRNTLTEMRIVCDREVSLNSAHTIRGAQNDAPLDGGSVELAVKPSSDLGFSECI